MYKVNEEQNFPYPIFVLVSIASSLVSDGHTYNYISIFQES